MGPWSLHDKGDYTSLLVDRAGNQYEPYSLAWRYLGMYIDCDDNTDRRLSSDDNEECGCKLLWAA
eukprot:12155859-Ditylum_brightwellii.AAC.1